MHRLLNRFLVFVLACVLVGALAGFCVGWRSGFGEASDRRRPLPNGAIQCRPGPWGELSYTPFDISAPEDMLPVRTIEEGGTHWFLKGYTADSLIALLQATSLSPDLLHELLGPRVLRVRPDGVELTPTADMITALPEDARAKIYQVLAQWDSTGEEVNFIPKAGLTEWFAASGVSPATVTLFKRYCCERGEYLMFSGVPAMLTQLQSYDEKMHLLRALTRQRTMLLRLHITPQVDVDALARYWGVGNSHTDVRAIFKSLATIPTGTWMSVLMVLPPQPAAEIYDYPRITDNPLAGPAVNRDCAWTSLNFFRDEPEPGFGTMPGVMKELKENYAVVTGEPRYGDVVLFARPDGYLVHAAIYMADDICFTKNGSTLMHPWMLSTMADIVEEFAFQLDPGQRLRIQYFRKKEFLD